MPREKSFTEDPQPEPPEWFCDAPAKELVVQADGYAEHRFTAARFDGQQTPIDDSVFSVRLAPGCGATLRLTMDRYVNQPTMRMPWDRN